MATIGLVIRTSIDSAQSLGAELIQWAAKNGHEVLLEKDSAAAIPGAAPGISREELVSRADPIVTLGGDGTLIGVARCVTDKSPVMLGVNFGNLGFLTEITPGSLLDVLPSVLDGTVKVGERSMLLGEVVRSGETIFSSQGVNDVVVQKGTRDKLLTVEVASASDKVMCFRGDGIIFSSPTGSTAYSVAAGGSIVYPSLSAVLVTPICAHTVTSRPLILPTEIGTLSVTIPDYYEGEVYVSVDGQVSLRLEPGDQVCVSKAPNTVRLVHSSKISYFDILRTKLNWVVPNKPN